MVVATRRDDRGDLQQVGPKLDPHVVGLGSHRLGHEPAGSEHVAIVQREHRPHDRVGDLTGATAAQFADQPSSRKPPADGHGGTRRVQPHERGCGERVRGEEMWRGDRGSPLDQSPASS